MVITSKQIFGTAFNNGNLCVTRNMFDTLQEIELLLTRHKRTHNLLQLTK